MNNELFSVGESLSPKLKWLKKHGLTTHFAQEVAGAGAPPENLYPWTCCKIERVAGFSILEGIVGVGNTEEEACIDYARKNDLPHWTISP